jgi:hypothetical protein
MLAHHIFNLSSFCVKQIWRQFYQNGILQHKKYVVNILTKALSIDKHEHFPCLMGMVKYITLNQGC